MKMLINFIIALFMAFLLGTIAHAQMFIDIEAHIDGRDQLIINSNTLQWHHFENAAVGRHFGANSPTIISTTENHFGWIPDWKYPPPDEIRFETLSSVFNDLAPLFPTDGVPWAVKKLLGPGEVNIIQQPSVDNGFQMIVEFNDNDFSSSRFYAVRLSPDSDNDGIPDYKGFFLNSDLRTTVVIGDCKSEVFNAILNNDQTISDLIMECADNATTHGDFVSCVTNLTNDLSKDGIITDQDKGDIQTCAAQAEIP